MKFPPIIPVDKFEWQEIGEDENNKRTRLLAAMQIGDCVFHVEAREFEADADPQTTVEFGDDYDAFCDLAGQTDFAPVTIEGREYFVFILPYEA